MAIIKVITPPTQRFMERLLVIGDAGAGKSTLVCDMARHMPDVMFHVNDTDVSHAYERLLVLEYPDVDKRGNLIAHVSSDWEEFVEANNKIKAEADAKRGDVIVIDNGTFPWGWVQDSHLQAQYGIDIDEFQANLRKQYKNDEKGYAKALADGMQWPIINKKFHKGFYKFFHSWPSHAIIVAMGKSTKGEKDEDLLKEFKTYGMMPAGQKDLAFTMHTNMILKARDKNKWSLTTTKDRGHPKVENLPLESFSLDYLVDIGGWGVERRRVEEES